MFFCSSIENLHYFIDHGLIGGTTFIDVLMCFISFVDKSPQSVLRLLTQGPLFSLRVSNGVLGGPQDDIRETPGSPSLHLGFTPS